MSTTKRTLIKSESILGRCIKMNIFFLINSIDLKLKRTLYNGNFNNISKYIVNPALKGL